MRYNGKPGGESQQVEDGVLVHEKAGIRTGSENAGSEAKPGGRV